MTSTLKKALLVLILIIGAMSLFIFAFGDSGKTTVTTDSLPRTVSDEEAFEDQVSQIQKTFGGTKKQIRLELENQEKFAELVDPFEAKYPNIFAGDGYIADDFSSGWIAFVGAAPKEVIEKAAASDLDIQVISDAPISMKSAEKVQYRLATLISKNPNFQNNSISLISDRKTGFSLEVTSPASQAEINALLDKLNETNLLVGIPISFKTGKVILETGPRLTDK